MDIFNYWKAVRAIEDSLPPEATLLVVSLDNVERMVNAGVICEVDRKSAAKLILGKTHRLANEKDKKIHEEREANARATILEDDFKRKQQFAMPRELTQLVEVALRAATTKTEK